MQGYVVERVGAVLAEQAQGAVKLVRTAHADADPGTPWQPGAGTETVYDLDAVVRGVSAQYLGQSSVLASDLQVVAAPFGVAPALGDLVVIDGAVHEIRQVIARPAAGPTAAWVIIVSGVAARTWGGA